MRINLNEIPPEGRTYDYSRKTGELNDVLNDLIGKNPYEVDLFIKPMGNAFEMTGNLASHKEGLCSKCGADMDLPLVQKVNEILIEEPAEYRKDQSVHGNGAIDFLADGPSVTHYRAPFFNVDDYVHEAFALAEPFYPECGENSCKNLKEVQAKLRELASTEIEHIGHPAFSVLEQLKGKSQ